MTPPGQTLGLKEAFDRHAAEYDARFSKDPRAMETRRRTWEAMDARFSPGDRVLDLGCGTGEDALHLAGRGIEVHAFDVSTAMIDRVGEKARRAGLEDRIVCRSADWRRIDPGPGFDGLYSNFGALNCVPDLGELGRLAGTSLKRGAPLMLVAMSRFYPLETAVNIAKGRFGPAFRRLRVRSAAVVAGVEFDVHYYSLGDLARGLGPGFALERVEALNLLTPAAGLDHLERRFPRLFRRLRPVDGWLARHRPASRWGDHFLTLWRRR